MLAAPKVGCAYAHNRQRPRVRAIATATVLLAAALALAGCSKPAGAANPAQAPLPTVAVTAPSAAMVQDSVEYTGGIEPSQRVELRLPSPAGDASASPSGFDRVAFLPSLESQVAEFFAEQWR